MTAPMKSGLLSGSLGGIALMIAASVVLIFQHSTAKWLSADLSVLEIVSFRTITALLFFLPWLDRSPVKSIRYKGWMSKTALVLFVISFIVLSYLGLKPASDLYVILARIFTAIYFLYFILMPWYTSVEKTKAAPERVNYHA